MSADPLDRFEALLRERARAADERSAITQGQSAERATLAGDALRRAADDFRSAIPPDQLNWIEGLGENGMRTLAMSWGWMAGWIEQGRRDFGQREEE
jgi:hypothetical protein